MNYLYFGIFVVFSAIHLYGSYKKNQGIRNATKPVILLALLGIYLESTSSASWWVVLAIIFSWLGDVLLIPKGVKWFAIGGISFMISHLFFIVSYCQIVNVFKLNWYIYVIFEVIFFALVLFIFSKLRLHLPKKLFYPMALYLLINGNMNCFAIFRCFSSNFSISGIITIVGACLFFISDATLFFVRFKKDSKITTHFSVMLTYTLAELLIIIGFII